MNALLRWHSIRLRLSLLSAGAVLLVAGVVGVVSELRLRTKLQEADQEFAEHEAMEVAHVLADAVDPADARRRVLSAEPRLFPEVGVEQLDVFTYGGAAVVTLPEGAAGAPWVAGLQLARRGETPVEWFESQPGHASIRVALLDPHPDRRWLILARVDANRSEGSLRDFRRTLALLIPLAGLLSFLGSYGLVTLALNPLQRVVGDARALAREGIGTRLATPPEGSELSELVLLLNVMLGRTEETMGLLRRFAGDASHELRTPLARIRGEAEVALRGQDPQAWQAALESVLEEAEGMHRLVAGLLELSRGEAPAGPGASCDLSGLCEDLAVEAMALGEARQVGFAARIEPGLSVPGRRELLARAVWNLLDNALKYTPAGERVQLSLTRDGEQVALTVSDSGPGIPADWRERVFEPFFRGDEARAATEGHGLGLPLSRTIVRRAGGELRLDPPDPARPGASFTISLPLAAVGEPARAGS